MWQVNNRCAWLRSTYSSSSFLLAEDQLDVIMKEDKLFPPSFLFFFSFLSLLFFVLGGFFLVFFFSGNSVKECKERQTFFHLYTKINTLKANHSIYWGSSWEVFDTARKLWAEFLLEHLLWLLVDNIIKEPFTRVILHVSWDDVSQS